MVPQQVATSDLVLVGSLAYLAFDIACEWEGFSSCPRPIHHWLIVSYGLLAASRIVVAVAATMQTAESGTFLLNSRQKGTTLRVLFTLTWMGLVPLFTAWSGLGTFWTWQVMSEAPQCMPSGMHLAFLLIWQVLSYAWIFVYSGLGAVACLLERRLRRAEADLRDMEEDPDVVARWGSVGSLDGYTSLPAKMRGGGLTPAQIRSLGGTGTREEEEAGCDEDCPICLCPMLCGDNVRKLNGCCHVFHRSCLDLWLLRSAECPMCKHHVEVPAVAGAQQ